MLAGDFEYTWHKPPRRANFLNKDSDILSYLVSTPIITFMYLF